METKITVEIHATKPSWIEYENNIYRLYINNDLLTERTWIWNLNTFIEENIWVDVNQNETQVFKLEPILSTNSVAEFELKDFMINGVRLHNSNYNNKVEVSFKL